MLVASHELLQLVINIYFFEKLCMYRFVEVVGRQPVLAFGRGRYHGGLSQCMAMNLIYGLCTIE